MSCSVLLPRLQRHHAVPVHTQVQWQVNGKVLEPSERVDMQTYGNHTTLDIPFSLRSDSGPYRLTLSNELGSDSAQATVTVLGQWSRAPCDCRDKYRQGDCSQWHAILYHYNVLVAS